MNKYFIGLMSVLFLFAAPVEALAATLSFSPSTGTFNRGCNFNLDIVVDTGGVSTDGTDAIIKYDPTFFSTNASLITNGTVYSDYPGNTVDEANGDITISGLASVTTPFQGKGTLASLKFTVKDTAPPQGTQITFKFDPTDKSKTTDSNVVERGTIVDVLNSVVNGNYTVGTGTCVSQGQAQPPGGQGQVATPTAQPKNLDQMVGDKTGTEEFTFMIAIIGGALTLLGILGLVLL